MSSTVKKIALSILSLNLYHHLIAQPHSYTLLQRKDKTVCIISENPAATKSLPSWWNFDSTLKKIDENTNNAILFLWQMTHQQKFVSPNTFIEKCFKSAHTLHLKKIVLKGIDNFRTEAHMKIASTRTKEDILENLNGFFPTHISTIIKPCSEAFREKKNKKDTENYFKQHVSHLSLSHFTDYKKLITLLNLHRNKWDNFAAKFLSKQSNQTCSNVFYHMSNYNYFHQQFTTEYLNTIVPLEAIFMIFASQQKKVIIYIDDHFSKILSGWLKDIFKFEQRMSLVCKKKTVKLMIKNLIDAMK